MPATMNHWFVVVIYVEDEASENGVFDLFGPFTEKEADSFAEIAISDSSVDRVMITQPSSPGEFRLT